MSGEPDPRPRARIRDPRAVRIKMLTERTCRACPLPAANAHHVVPKGQPFSGDDVAANIVGLCGSGTTGCHGLVHGADPAALRRVGLSLRTEEARYAVDRCGYDFLVRYYCLSPYEVLVLLQEAAPV